MALSCNNQSDLCINQLPKWWASLWANHCSSASQIEGKSEDLRQSGLTFLHNLQDDLPNQALEVWGVPHLAHEGAVEGELDVVECDGGVRFHDVPWPHGVALEATLRGRERFLLVVKHLRAQGAVMSKPDPEPLIFLNKSSQIVPVCDGCLQS